MLLPARVVGGERDHVDNLRDVPVRRLAERVAQEIGGLVAGRGGDQELLHAAAPGNHGAIDVAVADRLLGGRDVGYGSHR
jgi:hypothetical protein